MSNAQLVASARADIQTLLDALDTFCDTNDAKPYDGGAVKIEFQHVKALAYKYVEKYAATQLDKLAAEHHLCKPGALNKKILRLGKEVHSLSQSYDYGSLLLWLLDRLSNLAMLTKHDKSAENFTQTDPLAEKTNGEGNPAKAKGKRGRKPDTDPKADKRIYDGWKESGCKSLAEYAATVCGSTTREVKKAVDRHRKRLQRARDK